MVNKTDDHYELPLTPIIIRTMHRRLIQQGFSHKEAANLLAALMGLSITHKGWTLKQLLDLFFVEYLQRRLEEKK